MKKLIIITIVALVLSTFISIQAVTSISSQSTCISCHGSKHQENPLFDGHSNKSIHCIDCHSGKGVKGYVESRKELINSILLDRSRPALDFIFRNISINSSFTHLKDDCRKCHEQVKSGFYNHSNATNCIQCHSISGAPERPETGFWKKMETGGHRNKTCEDCHSTNFQIIICMNCHQTHKEGANWNNSACLACHRNPHIPVRSGILSESAAKENCAVCHEGAFETLTFYNSKHNELPSCVSCHQSHGAVKRCFDCHAGGHLSHPYSRENCASCHGKASCSNCHKEPHAPLMGLARITSQEQFNNYASTIKDH